MYRSGVWLVVVLVWLAVFRASRLLTVDRFPPLVAAKKWLLRRQPSEWLVYMFGTGEEDEPGCPWCVSLWLAAPIVWAADAWTAGGLAAPVLVWASASAAAGYLSNLEPG